MTAHDVMRWRSSYEGRTILHPIPGTNRFTLSVAIGGQWQHLTSNAQAADLAVRMERGI